ncbi:MAG TPA: hypothetical protein PLO89_04070 [Spirochaetota bacterium]|nr:hypothetical protein [Spirochaetota bacterium]
MNKYFFLLLLSPVLLFTSVACPDISTTTSSSTTTVNSGYIPVKKNNALVGDGVSIFHIETNGKVELEYTLDLGSYQKDVYFVFSNASLLDSSSNPEIIRNNNVSLDEGNFTDLKGVGLRGKPSIDKFNENPFSYVREDLKNENIEINRDLAPTADVEGDRKDLYTDVQSPLHKIAATCRKVVKNGTKTLNV